MLIIKVNHPFLYSSMKFFFLKICLIFNIGKWLWKSEFCYIWPSIPNQAKYLEPFYGRFQIPLAFLLATKLSCWSEVTLIYSYSPWSWRFISPLNWPPLKTTVKSHFVRHARFCFWHWMALEWYTYIKSENKREWFIV